MESSREIVDDVGIVLGRYSLDVSAGCGGRRSTLLDEYERLAFEAQLNSAIFAPVLLRAQPGQVRPAFRRRVAGGASSGDRRRGAAE
jgi:hypothetical protein